MTIWGLEPYSNSFNFNETAILEYQITEPGQRVSQDLLFPNMPSQHLDIIPKVVLALYSQVGKFRYLSGPGPPSSIAYSQKLLQETTPQGQRQSPPCAILLGFTHGKSHENQLLWGNTWESFSLDRVKTGCFPSYKVTQLPWLTLFRNNWFINLTNIY